MAYPPSRIPRSTASPAPILIPSLRVTAPTPGQTPSSSVTNDGSLTKKPKSVKSVRIQEPVRPVPPHVMMERLAREQVERQMEERMDRARVAPWEESDDRSVNGTVLSKKKGKENKKTVLTTLSGFRVLADPSPPLPQPVSQPHPLSRNASVRAPLTAVQPVQGRARADSRATLLSFKSNRSATSHKTTSSIATTSTTASVATTLSSRSIATQASGSGDYDTIREASSVRSKNADGLNRKSSRSRMGLDSLFHAWGSSKDNSTSDMESDSKEKEKSLWRRTIGRKSDRERERARSPSPSSIGRSGEVRTSLDQERARSPTPSFFSGRSQTRAPSPPPSQHLRSNSIAMVLEDAERPTSPAPGMLAPPSSFHGIAPDVGYPGLVESDKEDKKDAHGPRFMRSIRSIATFRQKQKDERSRDRGESTSSGSSFEAGAPSAQNSPLKPACSGTVSKPDILDATICAPSSGTVRSVKEVSDGTVRSASIFAFRSTSRASNHSDGQKARKPRSSTDTFGSVSSRDVTSLPPHLLRSDYPTPPSQLQQHTAEGSVARTGSKMKRPGLQGLFDNIKKHKAEKSRSEKQARESWVEVERPSFECTDDGKELIALAMPYVLPPSTEFDGIQPALQPPSPPVRDPNTYLPDLMDPTPKKELPAASKTAEQQAKETTSTASTVRLVTRREVQRTPRKSQRPMSDGATMDFMRDPVQEFSALTAANSELSDLISRLDLTVANTPDSSPLRPAGTHALPLPAPAFMRSAITRMVTNPDVSAPATPQAAAATLVDDEVQPWSIAFEKTAVSSADHLALPGLSAMQARQAKTISAAAREEWLDLIPTAMGASSGIEMSTKAIVDNGYPTANTELDFAQAVASSQPGSPYDGIRDSATLSLPAEVTNMHLAITPARGATTPGEAPFQGRGVGLQPSDNPSVSLTPSTLAFVAGNYLAYTAGNLSLSASGSSIYESAQETLPKVDDTGLSHVAPISAPAQLAPEELSRRAQSPPPNVPLPPTPEAELSFSFLMPGRMPSKETDFLSEPDTTLSTPSRATATSEGEQSPASRMSLASDDTLDFTQTYQELANEGKRKSFVKYVAHVSEEMFGDHQYLPEVLKINDSASHSERPTLSDTDAQGTGVPEPTHIGHTRGDSFSSLPSMYKDRVPGNSLILDLSQPSALHSISLASEDAHRHVAMDGHGLVFPKNPANRDSYISYSSYTSGESQENNADVRTGRENDTSYSIPSISSYGAIIKPGVSNPMGYTASERARLISTDSSIRPLTAATMAAMDEEQLRRRFNRESYDSVASTWSYHAPTRPTPLQYRTQGINDSQQGPPPAYLNNNKRNSLMRNRDSVDSQSAAYAYLTEGSIAGIVAAANRSAEHSRDSIMSEVSEMSPMSYQRRGRPAIADDKMFQSANQDGPLESIVSSPDGSEAGLASRPSFDSGAPSTVSRETDDEYFTDDEDSLFPSEGKRVSVADSLFSSEGEGANPAIPPLFQKHGRRPRPVSAMSTDSAFAPGPDDTVMTMLDGDVVRTSRSLIENSPSVHVALHRQARAARTNIVVKSDDASERPRESAQTVRFPETRKPAALPSLQAAENVDEPALVASGMSDDILSPPRIAKPAPPSARKRMAAKDGVKLPKELGNFTDNPSEGNAMDSKRMPDLPKAQGSKGSASQVMKATPTVTAGRMRPHAPGHRPYSGHVIDTIAEETATPSRSGSDQDSPERRDDRDLETMNEANKGRLDKLEKKKSLVHEVRESMVLFPGKPEEEEFDPEETEMPTTREAILNFLAMSQNKFKPRTDLPARTRTRSRTNSRPSPYPLPDWEKPNVQQPPLPTARGEQAVVNQPQSATLEIGVPKSDATALFTFDSSYPYPGSSKAAPRVAILDEGDQPSAPPRAVVQRPRVKSTERRQALAPSRRSGAVSSQKPPPSATSKGFVLAQAAKLNANVANSHKPTQLNDDTTKNKRTKATSAAARENEAAGLLVSPADSLRIARPKPKGRPTGRAPAPILLRN